MSPQRILVIDDDPCSRELLTAAVRALGHQASAASGGESALRRLAEEPPDAVLCDVGASDETATELARRVRASFPEVPVVLVTGTSTLGSAVRVLREGAADVLLKPCSPEAVESVLGRLVHVRRLEQENEYLRDEAAGRRSGTLVAESPLMLQLVRSASRVARSRGTVLITGETGAGKQRVAHYIHENSPRSMAPFVRANCAGSSETDLDARLFGRGRPGCFELADGGTLLLDELGDFPLSLQEKLLFALQEDQFERADGRRTVRVDVRVLATTRRDLAREVAEGRFREDLYYRLHVLPLHVPPLRERVEDVVPLATRFVEHTSRENGLGTPILTEEARRQLRGWSWPGNVRELESVIQRAVLLAREGRIGPADLVLGPAPEGRSEGAPAPELKLGDEGFARVLANNPVADIERVAILATLQATGGNKTEAARRLGLTARTLSNKMKIWKQAGLVA